MKPGVGSIVLCSATANNLLLREFSLDLGPIAVISGSGNQEDIEPTIEEWSSAVQATLDAEYEAARSLFQVEVIGGTNFTTYTYNTLLQRGGTGTPSSNDSGAGEIFDLALGVMVKMYDNEKRLIRNVYQNSRSVETADSLGRSSDLFTVENGKYSYFTGWYTDNNGDKHVKTAFSQADGNGNFKRVITSQVIGTVKTISNSQVYNDFQSSSLAIINGTNASYSMRASILASSFKSLITDGNNDTKEFIVRAVLKGSSLAVDYYECDTATVTAGCITTSNDRAASYTYTVAIDPTKVYGLTSSGNSSGSSGTSSVIISATYGINDPSHYNLGW